MVASTVSWWSSSPFLANKSVNPSKRSVPRSVPFPAKKCGEFRPLVRVMADAGTLAPKSLSQGKNSIPWKIKDDKKEIKMEFDISEVVVEDVKVTLEDNDLLLIRGEYDKGGADGYGGYRIVKSLRFWLPLPHTCEKKVPTVELDKGGLIITIPKKPEEHTHTHTDFEISKNVETVVVD